MKKKSKLLTAPTGDNDGIGYDELTAPERSLADLNDLNSLDLTRLLKELEAETQAMLNDIWSDNNERIEKLLAALNEEDDELLTHLLRSDEEDEKLAEKLLAELNEDEFELF